MLVSNVQGDLHLLHKQAIKHKTTDNKSTKPSTWAPVQCQGCLCPRRSSSAPRTPPRKLSPHHSSTTTHRIGPENSMKILDGFIVLWFGPGLTWFCKWAWSWGLGSTLIMSLVLVLIRVFVLVRLLVLVKILVFLFRFRFEYWFLSWFYFGSRISVFTIFLDFVKKYCRQKNTFESRRWRKLLVNCLGMVSSPRSLAKLRSLLMASAS